jgi:hypothetical protein
MPAVKAEIRDGLALADLDSEDAGTFGWRRSRRSPAA